MSCPIAPMASVVTNPPGAPATAGLLQRGRGNQTRARILQSAVRLFAQHDYDAVSLRWITGMVQLNMSLVKFHFGRKEALYLEALDYACQVGLEEVRRLPPPPGPGDPDAAGRAAQALEANIGMFVTLGLETKQCADADPDPGIRPAALALLGRALASNRPEARQTLREMLEAQRRHLEGCLRALRPDLDEELRFRIGTSIVGQGLLFFLFPALVDGARGSAYDGSSQGALTRHLTHFCLAGIRNFLPESPLDR